MFSFLLQGRVRLFKPFANFQRMTRHKLRRAHPASAFALQLQNPQRVLSTADDNAGFVCL